MNKAEFIEKNGVEQYTKRKEQIKDWQRSHPARVQAYHRKQNRKDGEHYAKKLHYGTTGDPKNKKCNPSHPPKKMATIQTNNRTR